MIGASKDAVVSWELGRNALSEGFARRVEFATGVERRSLMRRSGPLHGRGFGGMLLPYSRDLYRKHAETRTGRPDEVNARGHARNCAEALELLFVAAAQPVRRDKGRRLPALVQSFIQWCDQAREDFELEGGIDTQLMKRPSKLTITHRWGEWRRMKREDPNVCRHMGFKDDPAKPDGESLTLETTTFPIWRPGYPMRGQQGK